MKPKRRARKHVEFYCNTFDFTQPFKVLVDGNFLHLFSQTRGKGSGGVEEALRKLTGSKVTAFSTKCTSHELKRLGSEYKDTVLACKSLKLHKCSHASPVPSSECLLEQAGQGNVDQWWFATQDKALLDKFHKMANVPTFKMTINGMVLQSPSEKSVELQKKTAAEQMHVSEWEKQSGLLNLAPSQTKFTLNKHKPKRPIRPNPLSCKKKKRAEIQGTSENSSSVKKKPRKRRKTSVD